MGKFGFIFVLVIILLMVNLSNAQTQKPKEYIKATVTQDEIISMAASTPFDQAIRIISDLSKFRLNKIIVDPTKTSDMIGVDINKMHWLDALELILRNKNMWYTEYQDHILLYKVDESQVVKAKQGKTDEELYETREVIITAVFFEVNLNRIRQMGMSWNFFSSEQLLSVSQSAAATKTGIFEINTTESWDFGTITSIFKSLESHQAGEIIASPNIYVMSEEKGQIQIGSDYTVTVKDIAGNTVQQFFSTGSIIEVTPTVVQYDTVTFVHLELSVQKSSAGQSEIGMEIKKSEAKTEVLLLNGEETLLGGLISNETSETREGVPFLKDLPWWFFGMRYIFGYEAKSAIKKELVILIKADVIPTLRERAQAEYYGQTEKKTVDDQLDKMSNDLEEKRNIEVDY